LDVGGERGAEVCLLAEHFLGQSLLRHRPIATGDPLLHEKPQQILEPPRALQNTRHGVAMAQIFQYLPVSIPPSFEKDIGYVTPPQFPRLVPGRLGHERAHDHPGEGCPHRMGAGR
jgi:hypothetical protein